MIVYDSLERKFLELKPRRGNNLELFVCGQTVYDDAHIGHAKVYTNVSVIIRYIRHLGYNLKSVENVTDIDDKIIARAKERGMAPIDLARFYEHRLMEDLDALDIKRDIDQFLRSHDYIDAIRIQLQQLIDNGYAYMLDGDIYYNVAKFKDYTKLSGISLDDLTNHRIEPKEGKINTYDFALWKGSKDGEPFWEIILKISGKSVLIKGRPGWHIEDTAITASVFGPTYDIHCGAKELIFPHHTNEIAQAEAASGKKPFVRYWLHSGVLRLNGEKMSKSLGNFITIRDVLSKFFPEELKLMIESSQYSKEIDYRDELMAEAKLKLSDMYASLSLFYNMPNSNTSTDAYTKLDARIFEFERDFKAAMDDNFNTSLAITHLYSVLKFIKLFAKEENHIQNDQKTEILDRVLKLSNIIGILQMEYYKKSCPSEAKVIMDERLMHRKANDFKKSDELRSSLADNFGIGVEDDKKSSLWYWLYPKFTNKKYSN